MNPSKDQEKQKYTLFVRFTHDSYHSSDFIQSALGMKDSVIFSLDDGTESKVEFITKESDSSRIYKYLIKVETLFKLTINEKRYQLIKDYEEKDKPIPTKGQWATTVDQTCPPSLMELINENLISWKSPGDRLLKLMSWRSGVLPSQAQLFESLLFSLDNVKWIKVEYSNIKTGLSSCTLNKIDLTGEVQGLFANNFRQPLAMDLLDEAILVMYENERSAFVLAATALEVGVKDLIRTLKPEAGNMLFNTQSPPIEFLINHYIPEIVPIYKPSENLIKKIKNIVSDRNNLVHRGEYKITFQELRERLNTIRDLLYLFSFFEGHIWSRDFINASRLL